MEETDSETVHSLPDDILVNEIFNSIDTKNVVQSSSICRQWRNLWTRINYLNFQRRSFKSRQVFYNFVYQVLNHRQDSNLTRLKFNCETNLYKSNLSRLVKTVFNYAASHNIVQIETDVTQFSKTLQNCKTLTSLNLISSQYSYMETPLRFRYLKSLYLREIVIQNKCCHSLVRNCLNLEMLDIWECNIEYPDEEIIINAPNLINLTIKNLTKIASDGVYNKYYIQPLENLQVSSTKLKKLAMEWIRPYVPKRVDLSECEGVEEVRLDMCFPVPCNEEGSSWKIGYIEDMKKMVGLWFDKVEMVSVCLDFYWGNFVVSRRGFGGVVEVREVYRERKFTDKPW